MTNQSIYPTNRQKALFGGTDVKIKYHHVITSAAIMHFKLTFKLIMIAYAAIMILGGFELVGVLLSKGSDQGQMLSFGMALLVVVLSGTMGLMHNQVMLVLGHGYKSKESQLYVDRLTSIEECQGNVKVIRSMYIFSFVIAAVFLWVLWGLYGTPLYSGEWATQSAAAGGFIEQFKDSSATNGTDKLIKPFLWVATDLLLLVIGASVLGWIQAKVSDKKISG